MSRRGPLRTVLVALALGCATACSLLLDTERDQCATDADCAARGGDFAGARCVGAVCVRAAVDASRDVASGDAADAAPPVDAAVDVDPVLGCLGDHKPPVPDAGTAAFTVYFHDFLRDAVPVTDIVVRLCPNAADPQCTGVAATKRPDATGHVTFTLDLSSGPFGGYVATDPVLADGGSALVDGGDNSDAYMPSRIFYTSVPISADFNDDWLLPTYGTFQSFTNLYGLEPPDPKLGQAFLVTEDCRSADLAGVSVVVDSFASTTRSFYFINNAPSTTAASTDSSGYVGFLNLPTGARTYSAQIAATKQPLGQLTMYSIPGAISYAPLGPGFTP